MIEIIKELKIEVSKPNIFQAVVAKQYDMNTRFIKATLVDGENVIYIPNDPDRSVKAVINANRPDGQSKGFDGFVNDDGTVTVPLHSWMLELDGTVICDISIIDTEADDNKKLTTTSFTLLVEKASYGGGDVTNDPQYDVLVSLLETCQEAGEVAQEALDKSKEALKLVEDCEEAAENANKAAENANKAAEALNEYVPSRIKKVTFDLDTNMTGQLMITIGNFTDNDIRTNISFFNPVLLYKGKSICNPMNEGNYKYCTNPQTDEVVDKWNVYKGNSTTEVRSDGYLQFSLTDKDNAWDYVRYKQGGILYAGTYELSIECFGDIEQLPTMDVRLNGTVISTPNSTTITNVTYKKFRDTNVEYALEKGHVYLFSVKDGDSVRITDKYKEAPVTGVAEVTLSGLKSGLIVCADRCTCIGLTGDFSITNLNAFKNDKWDWENGPYYIKTTFDYGVDIWRI